MLKKKKRLKIIPHADCVIIAHHHKIFHRIYIPQSPEANEVSGDLRPLSASQTVKKYHGGGGCVTACAH